MVDVSVGSEAMASPDEKPTQKAKTKPLNLALRGGGAHGAFTWGVLNRLLEDDRVEFDGVSADERRRYERDSARLRHGCRAAAKARRRRSRSSGVGSGPIRKTWSSPISRSGQ